MAIGERGNDGWSGLWRPFMKAHEFPSCVRLHGRRQMAVCSPFFAPSAPPAVVARLAALALLGDSHPNPDPAAAQRESCLSPKHIVQVQAHRQTTYALESTAPVATAVSLWGLFGSLFSIWLGRGPVLSPTPPPFREPSSFVSSQQQHGHKSIFSRSGRGNINHAARVVVLYVYVVALVLILRGSGGTGALLPTAPLVGSHHIIPMCFHYCTYYY